MHEPIAHTHSFNGVEVDMSNETKDAQNVQCVNILGCPAGGTRTLSSSTSRASPAVMGSERERMSQWLVSSAPPKMTLEIISRIDEECEDAIIVDEIEIHQGPFGAFRLNQDQDTLPCLANQL
ncbi:hypothetical protein N7537_003200 [Penicillium hordei]|uniref:Uncharacterized protein n=1 Tax=Penicillium hordei TaxID=40994 RepID=A0AAD6MPP1_9EURO|nr:uncharacterized protein N7537_003200 [Penicillium hordei]KAJ5618086.1 hypothetical protein N7537_003200 [Penicillium hordei]